MQTRGGARPKRGRDSQHDQAQATGPAHVAQPVAQPHDDSPAPPVDAPAQASGSDQRDAQDGHGGEGSHMLLHRDADIDMGHGPDEEEGSPGAGNTDEESDDDTPAQALIRPQLGSAEERERGRLSPRAEASGQASAQRAANGVSPGGRPVAPPGLGRLARIVTPVGDMNGIDESIPGVVSYVWDDDPGCSSTASSWPSEYFLSRTHRATASPAPPLPTPTVASTPAEALPAGGGQMVLYAPPATGTASSSSQGFSSANLDRLMEGLRQSREKDELAKRADEVAKAIEDEQHEVRLELQAYRRAQGQAGSSRQGAARRRKQQTPCKKGRLLTTTENAPRDNIPDASWRVLHEQHPRQPVLMLPAPAEQAPAPAVYVRTDIRLPFGRYPLVEQEVPEARAEQATHRTMSTVLLEGDEQSGQAAWARASSAISEAVAAIVPAPLGRNKKGGVLITSKMRDTSNRMRAACQLVGALSLQTCSEILGRNLYTMAEKLHDEELYGTECADELVNFFARWGVSTLKGALSALTRLRAFAEMKGEYDAVDGDEYPAQLVSAFLDDLDARAKKTAEAIQAKAEAEGKELTVQQQRRDGRSAAKTAFRSLRFLLDNAKMKNSARDALVCKRKFAPTIPMPTPALEPPHYAQLCHLAAHHRDRVVRGTAAGFALVASQTSRFKQAQACAILAEKNGVIFTAVQLDKSNEPHKQSARPAFGPLLDAYGSRGVIDAVYDALSGVEAGCFLVRDNDSITGAPVEGSAFANGPIHGGRADAALQYLLTLPPLSCSPSAVQDFKVHSLKPMMLKHASRMSIGPVERHGLGRFSGSAAQNASLVPMPAELKRHQLKCAQLPDRYAQDSAFAADARTAVGVSKDIQRLVREHSIEALAAMEWADRPDHDEAGEPEA